METALQCTRGWEETRKYFADQYAQPFTEAQQISTREHFRNLLVMAQEGDAFVMTGDICDYISGANVRFVEESLQAVAKPYLYICGNHDSAQSLPDTPVFSRVKQPIQTVDLGDLLLVGIDDSLREITPEQNARLDALLEQKKPLLLVMHIPLQTQGNRERLEECGEYFRLNYSEASPEVAAFQEKLARHQDKIVAVLAGHLHFDDISEIVPGLPQFVATQGALGNLHRYEIGE